MARSNFAGKHKTSTDLYRSCAALASFSGTFDLILFEAVNFGFNFEKDCLDSCFALVEFGLFC